MTVRTARQRRFLWASGTNSRKPEGSYMQRIILIWGGLIFAYLLLTNSSGASTVMSSVTNFVTGTSGKLQGR